MNAAAARPARWPCHPCPDPKKVNQVQDITEIGARLRAAVALPDLLAASFDAFEIVRQVARSSDHRAPELFAAFMMTANAAVDGREAVTIAPAMPAGGSSHASVAAAGASIGEITAALTTLSALLADCLTRAATLTAEPGDQLACAQAAGAARRIRDLMADRGHDGHLR